MDAQPLVSFVIPTLNRGDYVVRAVRSCLEAHRSHHPVEVIVIDSSSDDGSFEALQRIYSGDTRVTLRQNSRDSGPLPSWLEGAESAVGSYFTFVWSDDIISPSFLNLLVRSLKDDRVHVVVGQGEANCVDKELEFPAIAPTTELLSVEEALDRYYNKFHRSLPAVSPVCSLFHARLIVPWAAAVRHYCQMTSIRREIMWKSAIGPDLMLYLMAFSPERDLVAWSEETTAQFSTHAGSISVSSQTCRLRIGYWLARAWFVHEFGSRQSPRVMARLFGYVLLTGVKLWGSCLFSAGGSRYLRRFGKEIWLAVKKVHKEGMLLAAMRSAISEASGFILWRVKRRFWKA